eukprot:jgi/Botrbrau1/18315/Bobra.0179s0043.1
MKTYMSPGNWYVQMLLAAADVKGIPQRATTMEEFILELKTVLEGVRVPMRPIEYLFEHSKFHLNCDGDWLEFGVFSGATINMAAKWRSKNCGPDAKVHGFDTFMGLPETWDRGENVSAIEKGAFNRNGSFPGVEPNVVLHKGLFADTLPGFIKEGRRRREETGKEDPGVSYMHVDCDLYTGASQSLLMNAPRMRPGMVLVFDELINYKGYRNHEMKALWEWLAVTGLHVHALAVMAPSKPIANGEAMVLNPPDDLGWLSQSVAFLVVP